MTYPQQGGNQYDQSGGQPPQQGYPQEQGYPQGQGYPSAPGYGQYGSYPAPQQQPGNGLAIAGMVCGIIGLLIFWIVLSPLAIIFGGIGWSRANNGAKYKGQAIAGVVLGVIGIIGYIILLAFVLDNGRFMV
ncbi:MAG: DUF4190 domain-containing protein [Jatrophihabitans sp.]